MRPDERDAALLLDMVRAGRLVVEFVSGRTLAEYDLDPMLRSAVERQIEIIGEAARRISDQFRESHSEIPWRKIVAQRHILAHEYGAIQSELMWRVATVHVPEMLELVLPLITPAPPPNSSATPS